MKVYAPNIHLFAFQIYEAPNIEIDSLKVENINLWKSADEIVSTVLKDGLVKPKDGLKLADDIDIDKEKSNKYCALLQKTEKGFYSKEIEGKLPFENSQLPITGFAFPLRIYDSYGLWLNLRRPEEENNAKTDDVHISFLSELNKDNCLILPKDRLTLSKYRLFLGQTLLITAWLTKYADKETVETTASECLKAVFCDTSSPQLTHQGELFGSPIFEYGRFTQLTEYQHVLIWLFRDEQADAKLNQCYYQLLDLFFFRTKVVKAFHDSREIYKDLDRVYRHVEQEIGTKAIIQKGEKITVKKLDEFKEKLSKLHLMTIEYTRFLRDLEACRNTININKSNYRNRLQAIRDITNNENLSFLKTFINKSIPYFQQQIQADLEYFNYGSEMLEDSIESIRGIVDIEQAKRDWSLERTVLIASFGFGGGAIFGGAITEHIEKPFNFPNPKNPTHPIVSSSLWSLAFTIVFGVVGWALWNLFHHNDTKA